MPRKGGGGGGGVGQVRNLDRFSNIDRFSTFFLQKNFAFLQFDFKKVWTLSAHMSYNWVKGRWPGNIFTKLYFIRNLRMSSIS